MRPQVRCALVELAREKFHERVREARAVLARARQTASTGSSAWRHEVEVALDRVREAHQELRALREDAS